MTGRTGLIGSSGLHVAPATGRGGGVRSMMGRLAAVLIVACASGCERDRPSGQGAPAATESPAERIDRLRSLPYVGFTGEEAEPDKTGVVHYDEQRSAPGYNLYSCRPLCRADLIDMTGRVVRSWHQPGRYWERCELLPDGDVLLVGAGESSAVAFKDLTDDTRFALRLSWDNRVVWKRQIPVHHDVEVTPGGELLVLTIDYRRVPEISPDTDIRDDTVSLLSPEGKLLESCSLYDAFSAGPAAFTFQPVAPQNKWGRDMIDLFHGNSVEWMRHKHLEERDTLYSSGNVLVCSRHQDTVGIINWEKKELVWAWGQGEILGPHDATVLANGHILLFDNRLGRDWSRVIELDPLTREIVWEYKAPNPEDFYTASRGSNQRLANGNTLIAHSDAGRAFEVTPDGRIVWEFYNPNRQGPGRRATIVRIKRYEPDYVERIIARHGADE